MFWSRALPTLPSPTGGTKKDMVLPLSADVETTATCTVTGSASPTAAVCQEPTFAMREAAATKSSLFAPPPVKKVSWKKRIGQLCRQTVDSKAFTAVGIVLTVWALSGDDLRLICTSKPADNVFNALILVMLVFFSTELGMSCLGKEDYVFGFFFWLDLVSTFTLILDLTWVAEAAFGDGGADNESSKARSSKTARAGARVGRVVRVLRLVRIVKLFKAWQSQGASARRNKDPNDPEAFSWEEEDDDPAENGQGVLKESLVGKKLSTRTTQRTIVLVLLMLIVLPLLSTDNNKTPSSAEYGADDVYKAFKRMLNSTGTREAYEATLLKYIFYHNWFTGAGTKCPRQDKGCPSWFYSQLFWVGISGPNTNGTISALAQLARIRPESAAAFNNFAAQQDNLYNYGTMPDGAMQVISTQWGDDCISNGAVHIGFSLLEDTSDSRVGYRVHCPSDLRNGEKEVFTPKLMTDDDFQEARFTFYFDLRPYVKDGSTYNLIKTAFICVVLCVASLLFSSDANALVLQPVEEMITKIEAIRDNPLIAMKMADEEFKREEVRRLRSAAEKKNRRVWRKIMEVFGALCNQQRPEPMETVILEKTIIKLGSLLALGFGEAGANIVSHNMKGADSAGVDAMIEGSRVECIIGVARIRDFSIATEVLQGKVMTFVNQVAEIVHGIVDQFHGAVNKNNGDMFLIIWRKAANAADQVSRMAEMSIIAFARIVAGVHCSPVLASYRRHPGLLQRLHSRCRVDLTFGLHCGWAIEGAVGSEFKIDASYLSPNVSMATSIERATKIYEVNILVSQAVVELCTAEMTSKLRLIDKVIIRGSTQPLKLYCLDLDYMSLDVEAEWDRPVCWNSQQRYISRQLLEAEKHRKWSSFSVSEIFEGFPAIASMRRRYSSEFQQVFSMGYQNYSEGEWMVACQMLRKTRSMLGTKDGPSAALLRFMESPHNFESPVGWQGVHDLAAVDGI